MPELDGEIASIQNGMREIVDACEKALKKHQGRNVRERMKSYSNLKELKEQSAAYTSDPWYCLTGRQLRMQIQQTKLAATQFAAVYNVQENVNALRNGINGIVLNASNDSQAAGRMFGIGEMNKLERKQSLRMASLDLAAASEEAERRVIELKIRVLQNAVKEKPAFLAPERTLPPDGYNPIDVPVWPSGEINGKREDAMVSLVALLRDFQDAKRPIVPIVLFKRGSRLTGCLTSLGFRDEAFLLRQICHSVILQLHESQGDLYAADLACSFCNLSSCLHYARRYVEALESAQTSAEIMCTRLTKNDLEHYNPILATSYFYVAWGLLRLERYSEATDFMQVAVEIMATHAATDPSLSNLAGFHRGLDVHLPNLGRHEGAVKPRQYPAINSAKLAQFVGGLGNILDRSGRPDEAVIATRRAVNIWRKLAEDDAAAHGLNVARSLNNLACYLGKTQVYEEALEHITACLSMLESALKSRTANTSGNISLNYANALETYSCILEGVSRHGEAMDAARKATELFEALRILPIGFEESRRLAQERVQRLKNVVLSSETL